jgi:hypothetical protein
MSISLAKIMIRHSEGMSLQLYGGGGGRIYSMTTGCRTVGICLYEDPHSNTRVVARRESQHETPLPETYNITR